MQFDNHKIKISASIGIASFPDDAKDYDELLRKADMALYEVKRKGRNNFQFFDAAWIAPQNKRLICRMI